VGHIIRVAPFASMFKTMPELASRPQLRAALIRWVLVLVPACLLMGILSGVLSNSGAANAWYAALSKPAINPPPVVFPVVWSLLYALMGVAMAVVIAARGAWGRDRAVIAFALQMVFNLAWSPLFFAAHRIGVALVVLLVLDALVVLCVVTFWRVRPLAGALLLPYLAWVLFATLLNWQFLALNPWADGALGAPAAAVHLRIAPAAPKAP